MKLSKLLFALACIASTCCIYATSVWDGTAEMWTVGSGTESDPYQIQTAQNLAYLAQSVNSGNSYSDKFFIQTDDINLNNIEWTSIGGQYDRVNYETSHFDASFDGANHSISNVKISGVGDGTYGVGLFGYCKGGGALKNINATVDVNFSNSNSVGGIVGYSEVPMVNCSARGTINYSSVGVGTGGVAGYSGSEMSLCINYCDITGDGSSAVGGVVGRANHGGGLSYCTNYGDIKSELGGYYYFGGVVAECDGNINGCVNYGDVSGAYYCSGVVVYASSSNSTISLCKNFGNITAGYENNQERSYATGVVYSSSGDVNDCVNYGNVSSNYESCGIANMAGGIIEKCSNHGAVSAISTQSSDENVYASGINMSGNISDCYNTGTITATSDNPDAVSHAYGCSRSGQVFNTYNAGKLIGDDNYGLVDDDESVTNSFYLESCGGSGAGISISSEQMQSSSFIEALDTESGAVFVSDVDGINNGYPILYLEQTFNVVFKNYDGAVLQSEKLLYDNMPVYKGQTPIRQSDAQYSYSFSGWDPAIERVSESQDYVAVYTSTVNKYEIRFVNYDGTVLQKSDVGYGEIPVYTGSTPVRPSESGNTYTFTGWSPELIAVNGAATYVATYRVVGTVKDRCSNTYNYVKIGSQYWMTENMRCTVYDTQSEQAGKTISYIRYDYPKQNQPYYTNYSDTSAGGDCVPSYIPEDVKSKLGLLYNWAAAVGLQNESEIESTTTDFSGIRQGICPNGWHIPTSAEWKSLRNYIEKVDGKGTDSAGKHLKSTVGWNSDGNGLDTYGFAVVPSGWSIDYAMSNVGVSALLVSATANSEQKIVSYSMSFSRDNMNEVTSFDKKYAYGVRCVKSAQFEVRFVNYNGDLLQIKELNYGEMPSYTGSTPTKPADAQYSYSFSGWSPTISAVTKDQIYTAQFSSTVNKYVIRFLNEDGTVLQTENLDYGTIPVYKGETPTKQPTAQYTYTFNGWDSEIGKVTGAKDYIATYSSTISKYLIIFENYNGDELQSGEVEYGQIPSYTGATPVRPSTAQYTYSFNGWDSEIVAVDESKTYTAQFSSTVNKYLITFENYDGTELQSKEVSYGDTPVYTGVTPVKPSTAQYTYSFNGWDSEIVAVDESKTYTAQYSSTVNKYVIRFLNEDGTELQNEELDYGVTPVYKGTEPSKAATKQYSYTFAGWNNTIVPVDGAKDYTATYSSTVNRYLITFENYDGTELQRKEVSYGDTPVYTGATPVRPSTAQYTYNFTGWDSEIVAVDESKTYTAQFSSTVNKYTVRFLNEDGTELQNEELDYGTIPVYKGETPTKQPTAQYTYTFNGWDSEVGKVTGAKDYIATYSSTINKYLITFENYNGDELQSGEVEYGQIPSYTGATPEKPADAEFTYTFSGWSPEVVSVVGAQTYTAQFSSTVNKYVVRFLNEDGTELQSEELDYGTIPVYTGEIPTKDATAQYTYTFNGWDSEIGKVTGAKDYTATYSSIVNKYLITFENYNGDELQSSEVEYGQTPSYTGTTPIKPADAEFTYTFSGWSPEVVAVVGAQTYTAQFSSTVNKYTITLSGINCDVTGDGVYDYGTEVELRAAPHDGYAFQSWSDGNTDNPRTIVVDRDYDISANMCKASFEKISATIFKGDYYEFGDRHLTQRGTYTETFLNKAGCDSVVVLTLSVIPVPTYNVRLSVYKDDTWGSVTGDGTYRKGTTATLNAVPASGYKFSYWYDQDTQERFYENPLSFVVEKAVSLTASFSRAPKIKVTYGQRSAEVEGDDEEGVISYVVSTKQHVDIDNVGSRSILIYNTAGQIMLRQVNVEHYEGHLPSGVYIINIDGVIEKFVVR